MTILLTYGFKTLCQRAVPVCENSRKEIWLKLSAPAGNLLVRYK